MVRFVEHRVADPRILRLTQKWLNAGVMEEGKWSDTKTGSPQGSVISPFLVNIYPHYAFDLWEIVSSKKWAQGDVVVVHYCGRHHPRIPASDRSRSLPGKLAGASGKVWLELHPDKTRRIEFGR